MRDQEWTDAIVGIRRRGESDTVGTGYIAAADYRPGDSLFVVTCRHVLTPAQQQEGATVTLEIITAERVRRPQATVLALSDAITDIAVLALPAADWDDLPQLPLAGDYAPSETPFIAGGHIGGERLYSNGPVLNHDNDELHIAATFGQPGFSGGPIYHNEWGQVLGIVRAGATGLRNQTTQYTKGVPADVIHQFFPRLTRVSYQQQRQAAQARQAQQLAAQRRQRRARYLRLGLASLFLFLLLTVTGCILARPLTVTPPPRDTFLEDDLVTLSGTGAIPFRPVTVAAIPEANLTSNDTNWRGEWTVAFTLPAADTPYQLNVTALHKSTRQTVQVFAPPTLDPVWAAADPILFAASQRNREVSGSCTPGATIRLALTPAQNDRYQSECRPDGTWGITLDPLPAAERDGYQATVELLAADGTRLDYGSPRRARLMVVPFSLAIPRDEDTYTLDEAITFDGDWYAGERVRVGYRRLGTTAPFTYFSVDTFDDDGRWLYADPLLLDPGQYQFEFEVDVTNRSLAPRQLILDILCQLSGQNVPGGSGDNTIAVGISCAQAPELLVYDETPPAGAALEPAPPRARPARQRAPIATAQIFADFGVQSINHLFLSQMTVSDEAITLPIICATARLTAVWHYRNSGAAAFENVCPAAFTGRIYQQNEAGIVAETEDGRLVFYPLDEKDNFGPPVALAAADAVSHVQLSEAAAFAVIAGADGTVQLCPLLEDPQSDCAAIPLAGDAPVDAIAISRDETLLVSGDRDGNVQLWEIAPDLTLSPIPWDGVAPHAAGAGINVIHFFPAGDRFLTADDQGQVALWDMTTGTATLLAVPPAAEGAIIGLDVSGDGQHMLAVTQAGQVILWSARADTFRLSDTVIGAVDDGDPIYAASFSQDGTFIRTMRQSGTVEEWTPDGQPFTPSPPLSPITINPPAGYFIAGQPVTLTGSIPAGVDFDLHLTMADGTPVIPTALTVSPPAGTTWEGMLTVAEPGLYQVQARPTGDDALAGDTVTLAIAPAPTIDPVTGYVLVDQEFTLTGRGDPQHPPTILVNGAAQGEAPITADGQWQFTLSGAAEPSLIGIEVRDGETILAAGPTITVAANATPALTTPIRSTTQPVQGVGQPDSQLALSFNGVPAATIVTVDENGRWQAPIPAAAVRKPFQQIVTLRMEVVAANGNDVLYITSDKFTVYVCSQGIDRGDGTYVVGGCESLAGIAGRQGITLMELLALNPEIENPNLILAGQIIRIR